MCLRQDLLFLYPRPVDAVSTAAALTDRLDCLLVRQFGQIALGRGAAHLGEADGLAQGHAAREPLRFGIQQAVEQFLLAAVEAAMAVAPPESGLRCTALITALLSSSPSSWTRGGASKCRRSRPLVPKSTCIGAPSRSSPPGSAGVPASPAQEWCLSSGTGASSAAARSRMKPSQQLNRFMADVANLLSLFI